MSEAEKVRQGGNVVSLLATVVLVLVLGYALAFAPALKVCVEYPAAGKYVGPLFESAYGPLIRYLNHNRFGRADNFYYWYCTAVWRIPLYRN